MRARHLPVLAFAAATAAAQSTSFAPPVRVKAGDAFLGEDRLFPSPVYHDLDGDGVADIVVGDLVGQLTVAHGVRGAKPGTFGVEAKVMGADGAILNFANW